MLAGTPIARYLSVGKGLKASRLVREQSITFDGSDRDCYVVEAEYQKPATAGAEPASTTYWIDKARHLVIRDSTRVKLTGSAPANAPMHMVQVTTLSVARVNESLPDSLFSFRPPPEAKEVNQISMPGSQPAPAELVGKPAAAFTLKNLSGKPTSLAAWKGKVVLLDFWASWCGPCRMELPTIAKLHREYKNKGLAVVGVNVGETAGVAGAFLKKNNYTFPVLLDSNNQISDQYGATAIPTVVIIDRSGVVSSHFVGVRSEEDLREALKKAGMQ
jgi:thiol-disulfide isomerase/thioredoxin